MARKRKQEEAPAGMPAVLPQKPVLEKLSEDVGQATKRKDSAVGQIRELISHAVNKHALDKTAWALAQRLHRLDDERLAVTWRQLLHICEALGVDARATAQGEMFTEAETAPVNVVPLKRGRGRPKKEQAAAKKTKATRKFSGGGNGEDPVQKAVREHASKVPPIGDAFPEGPGAGTA